MDRSRVVTVKLLKNRKFRDSVIAGVILLKTQKHMYKLTWFTEHDSNKITCSHMTCSNEPLAIAFYEKFVEDGADCTLDGDTIRFLAKYDFESVVNVSRSMIDPQD